MSKLATKMYSTCFSAPLVGYCDRTGRCRLAGTWWVTPLGPSLRWTVSDGCEEVADCAWSYVAMLDSAWVDCDSERLLLGTEVKEGRRCRDAVLLDVPVEFVLGLAGRTVAMVR